MCDYTDYHVPLQIALRVVGCIFVLACLHLYNDDIINNKNHDLIHIFNKLIDISPTGNFQGPVTFELNKPLNAYKI